MLLRGISAPLLRKARPAVCAFFRGLLHGDIAARIPLEQFLDQWRGDLVTLDDLPAVRRVTLR